MVIRKSIKTNKQNKKGELTMKKILGIAVITVLAIALMAGCTPSETTDDGTTDDGAVESTFDASKDIAVISREDGSGTRGAFVELVGLLEEDANGEEVDMTTVDAEISSSTGAVITSVAGNEYAIGYISLGSLDDTVKALKVDGVEVTVDNIISGDYKISRPFNLATLGEVSENAQDFLDFIMSADGQAVVVEEGYIAVSDAPAYSGSMTEGKVVLAGSTSVSPCMEKLAEAYNAINPDVVIEIQSIGSSAGMEAAIDGICDIGMASRELKDSELQAGLTPIVMAMDGIAVIVNKANPMEDISTEQINAIYRGEVPTWAEVQ
jgi:phosphate transport system substrate-binding protein